MRLGKLFRTTVFKLSFAYLLLFSLGAWLALASVGARVTQVLHEQAAQTVDAEMLGLAEQYEEGGIRQLTLAIERRVRAPGGAIYLVTTYNGDVIAGNVSALPPMLPTGGALTEVLYEHRGNVGASHHALARQFVLPGGFRLVVGADTEDQQALRGILKHALGVSLFWLSLFGTLGGLAVAHRVLERVDLMSASARRIMAGELNERLPVSEAGDELDRLAENLNAMLERIEELMAGLREVSDNIAHDLRTPLTRLRNRAEEALRAGDEERARAALAGVIDESDGLIRVFDALLLIARAEAGSSGEAMGEVDAGAVLRDIVDMYEPVAEEQGVRLLSSSEGELIVRGNKQLLGQTLVNLVDNALKYGASSARPSIEARARRVGRFVEIIVADHGPGIAPQDRERVLQRFVRLENSRSRPGSGLGLSLAAAVARLHHGALRIEDNAPGLRAIISLPAARVAASRAERGKV